jgi:hypothetical protein
VPQNFKNVLKCGKKPFLNEIWGHVLIFTLVINFIHCTVSFIIIEGGGGCKFSPLDDKKKFSTSNEKEFVKKEKSAKVAKISRKKYSEIAIFR